MQVRDGQRITASAEVTAPSPATVTVTGLRRIVRASSRMLGETVAENSNVCRVAGSIMHAAGLPEQWIPIIWFPTVVLGIGLAYLAALISWNLLEKHFLALKHRFAANSAA